MIKIILLVASLSMPAMLLAGSKLYHPTNVPHSATLPSTCVQGDMYQDSNATSGQQWYLCESANTWVKQGDGGGSGGGVTVYPATSTILAEQGILASTLTFNGISPATGVLKVTSGVVSVSTYSLVSSLGAVIDGGGSVIVSGSTRSITIPFDCSISSWSVLADTSGNISVDVKRSTFANYPTIASLVGSGNKPSLSSAQKNAATPSSWTATYINAGDTISFVVDSATTITWATVVLWVTKL